MNKPRLAPLAAMLSAIVLLAAVLLALTGPVAAAATGGSPRDHIANRLNAQELRRVTGYPPGAGRYGPPRRYRPQQYPPPRGYPPPPGYRAPPGSYPPPP
jgi:hypothetical protein